MLPEATGVAPSMRIEWILGSDEAAKADVLSAVDREDALALELRRADGTEFPQYQIQVRLVDPADVP
jgi:hypothetical protein